MCLKDLAWDGETTGHFEGDKQKMAGILFFLKFLIWFCQNFSACVSVAPRVGPHESGAVVIMSNQVKGIELAKACVKAAEEIQAEDIQLWDVRGLSTITDFVVLCSGSSMPHLRAIMRDVAGHVIDWHNVRPILSEGNADSRWVVLDYIDVMVHILHVELREYYDLESLWSGAKLIELQDA